MIEIFLALSVFACSNLSDVRVHVSDDFEVSAENPICGILATVVAAQALGKNVDIDACLSSEFVSTSQGSTIADVKKLASLIGISTTSVSDIDSFFLKNISNPVVLNLAVRSEAKCDARWITIDGSTKRTFRSAQYGHIRDVNAQRAYGICLVNARTKQSRGTTIPGSIPIGVDLNIEEFRVLIDKVDKTRPIVVFCNSSECSWADIVGQRLEAFGCKDIAIYEPGMVGFFEHQKIESSYASRNNH